MGYICIILTNWILKIKLGYQIKKIQDDKILNFFIYLDHLYLFID